MCSNTIIPLLHSEVNRGYSNLQGYNTESERMFIEYVTDWLYLFTRDIETEEEEHHCVALLEKFISESSETSNSNRKISKALATSTLYYLQNSFVPTLHLKCHRHFMDEPGGDTADNCGSESENSSMKRDVRGPKPNQKLSVSCHATALHVEGRIDRMQDNANRAILCSQNEYTGDDVEERVVRNLQQTVVGRIRKMVAKQYKLSVDYCYMPVEEETNELQQVYYVRSRNLRTHTDDRSPCPLYVRTRYVLVAW